MVNKLIVCGGTFDHFHKGHSSFLKFACSVGKKLIIGITSDEFVGRWKIEGGGWNQIESFEERKKAVLDLIKKNKVSNKVEIVKIDDLFGPTLSESLIDGIVISENTKKGAEIINQKRKKLNLNPLKIFISPSVSAENGKLISSAGIRNGEIDREGKLYIKPAWLNVDLVLPEILRKEFKKPFGVLKVDISERQNQFNWIVTVGDVTTKKLNQLSINQKISVIDFKVARRETFSSFSDLGFCGNEIVITAENPAGHIMHDLFSKSLNIFKSNFEKRVIFKIIGEEDLVVLPLALVAPLGTIIYYGQPEQGIMRVEISEKIKKIAFGLVDEFEVLK